MVEQASNHLKKLLLLLCFALVGSGVLFAQDVEVMASPGIEEEPFEVIVEADESLVELSPTDLVVEENSKEVSEEPMEEAPEAEQTNLEEVEVGQLKEQPIKPLEAIAETDVPLDGSELALEKVQVPLQIHEESALENVDSLSSSETTTDAEELPVVAEPNEELQGERVENSSSSEPIVVIQESSAADGGFFPSSKKKTPMGLGIGMGIYHTPYEADLLSKGNPLILFWDFEGLFLEDIKWRLGYNATQSKLEFEVQGQAQRADYEGKSIYLLYRTLYKIENDIHLIALAGMDYLMGRKSGGSGSFNGNALGYRVGIGTYYYFGALGLGVQYEFNSATASFNGVKTEMGSNQVQFLGIATF